LVTAMKNGDGDRSIEVTLEGNLIYYGLSTKYWEPDCGWFTVEIAYDKTLDKPNWKTIINTKNNQVDDSIVAFVSGHTSKQEYYTKSAEVLPEYLGAVSVKGIKQVGFALKGQHSGIMRVRHMTDFSALFGIQHEIHVVAEDYMFMISGEGYVDLVDPQTRYVAGVDTVKFSVTTGYSGYTQGGEYCERGWQLKLYDNFGDLKKTWYISDDKHNTRYDKNGELLNYEIPADAVSSDASHRWYVSLTNTLFEQDYKRYFVVTEEELKGAPDIKTPEFGDTFYHLGDTVTINLEGIPNTEGRNSVDGFLVDIRYGGFHGTDFVQDYNAKYIKATGSKATISFKASKGDTYVAVEAWAFDAPENTGGIMSEKGQAEIWIKDKENPPIADNWIPIIVAVIVFIAFLIISFFVPLPPYGKIGLIILGAVLAFVSYYLLLPT